MLSKPLSRHSPVIRLVCVMLLALVCALPLSGLRVFAADLTPEPQDLTPPRLVTATPLPPNPADMRDELFPADVQTVTDGDTRQIIKTYVLSAGQSPADIPRDNFTRDGWRYTLTDITEKRVTGTDVKPHTETITINTDSNDLNAVIPQLAPTLDYQGEDGYAGALKLDLTTVKCEEAGTKTSSFTATEIREYPHLSSPDLSLVPKSITYNGRTLNLADVSWETQHTVAVDYEQVPESYKAIAKYTRTGTKIEVTGYVTTADYVGEVTKAVAGDTVYTAYFEGAEINPTPKPSPTATPTPTETPQPSDTPTPGASNKPDNNQRDDGSAPLATMWVIPLAAILALFGGAGAFLFLRRNVKVYRDDFRVLVAKDKLTAKAPVIDLTPLEGDSFGLVIDKLSAKGLNGVTVDVRSGATSLKHKIAYEGNAYKIAADFGAGTIQAIY